MNKINSKKVLIISYTFPPNAGIGGRRWAKFAKYLYREGVDIFIISVKSNNKNSAWNNDITEFKDKVNYLKINYPKQLRIKPQTFLQKILYRISLAYVKLFLRGNYYDPSSFLKKKILKHVEFYIKKDYNNIIISGAPFKQLYFVSKLKRKYPEVNFIADFRDPWTTNRTSYGFENLNSKRQSYEKKIEKEVINTYDIIFSVSKKMNDYFKTLTTDKNKFHEITNGYDTEDFSVIEKTISSPYQIKFIFAGTFYQKAGYLLEKLKEVLIKIQKESPEILNMLQFDFYGTSTETLRKISKECDCIKFHGKISLKEVYEKILNSDLTMLFLTDDINYSFSTKFYEYIFMKKKIAVFSNGGHTGKYVEQYDIGYNITPENMYDKLCHIIEAKKQNKLSIDTKYNIKKHSIERLTLQIIEHLK